MRSTCLAECSLRYFGCFGFECVDALAVWTNRFAPLTCLLKFGPPLTTSLIPSPVPGGGEKVVEWTWQFTSNTALRATVALGFDVGWPTRCAASSTRPPQKLLGNVLPSGATPQPYDWNAIVRVSVSVPVANTVVPCMWTKVPLPLADFAPELNVPVSTIVIVSPFAARAILCCASGGRKLSPTWTSKVAFDDFDAAPLTAKSVAAKASANTTAFRLILPPPMDEPQIAQRQVKTFAEMHESRSRPILGLAACP
jgi:hypothetical protein